MNAENKFIKPETVISTCSLIVAVCAIFISTYQAYLSREHNRISTRPILQFDVDLTYDSLDNDIGLGFKNVGLGPAKIHKMDMLFGNKWINLLDKKKVSEFLESTGLGYWYFSPGIKSKCIVLIKERYSAIWEISCGACSPDLHLYQQTKCFKG